MTDPAAPVPSYSAAPAVIPGKTLGIVGLVAAFFIPLLGLILSLVARSQSKAVGYPNTPAKIGVILSIIFIVLYVIIVIVSVAAGTASISTSTY